MNYSPRPDDVRFMLEQVLGASAQLQAAGGSPGCRFGGWPALQFGEALSKPQAT
jgi:hypothetical protein